jgi:hypothetical protein
MRLIYNPQLDTPSGIRPLGFQCLLSRSKAATKDQAQNIELKTIWLIPGVNEISDEDWAFISKHKDAPEKMRSGAIKPIQMTLKEGQKPSETLADYALLDAREIIFNCFDVEWLERVKVTDTRNEIFRWTQDRIANVQKMQQGSAQGSIPSQY